MLTHSTTAKDASNNAVLGLLTAGSKLVFRVGGTLASPGPASATLYFDSPAFQNSSGGQAVAGTITKDSNAAGNASPVSTFSMETGSGTLVIYGSVGLLSGGDINLDAVQINAGDTVEVTSLVYQAFD